MTPPDPAFIIRAKARNPAASEPDELRSVPKCAPKRQLCALRNANYAICVPMFAHSAFRRALRNANRVSQEIGAIRAPRMAVWRGGLGQWHVWQSRKVRPRGREENTAMRYAARGRRPKPRIACITRHTRPSRRRTVARWQIRDWSTTQIACEPATGRPPSRREVHVRFGRSGHRPQCRAGGAARWRPQHAAVYRDTYRA